MLISTLVLLWQPFWPTCVPQGWNLSVCCLIILVFTVDKSCKNSEIEGGWGGGGSWMTRWHRSVRPWVTTWSGKAQLKKNPAEKPRCICVALNGNMEVIQRSFTKHLFFSGSHWREPFVHALYSSQRNDQKKPEPLAHGFPVNSQTDRHSKLFLAQLRKEKVWIVIWILLFFCDWILDQVRWQVVANVTDKENSNKVCDVKNLQN